MILEPQPLGKNHLINPHIDYLMRDIGMSPFIRNFNSAIKIPDRELRKEATDISAHVLEWIIKRPVINFQPEDRIRYIHIPDRVHVVAADKWTQTVKEYTEQADKLQIKNPSSALIQAIERRPQKSTSELSDSDSPTYGITINPLGVDIPTAILLKAPAEGLVSREQFLNALVEEHMHAASPQMSLLESIRDASRGMLELMTNYCRFLFLEQNYPNLLLQEDVILRAELHKVYDPIKERVLNLQFRGRNDAP